MIKTNNLKWNVCVFHPESKNPISIQLLKLSDKLKKEITEFSSFYSTSQIIQILNILAQCQKDYTQTTNKRFIF